MAVHSANGVTYYLSLPVTHKNHLGAIRHWDNLKVGFEGDTVWVKDFSPFQFDSLEVKTLPHKTLYYSNGHRLFLHGSLLPDQALPNVLWSPIERGLPASLPAFNHNFFGLNEKAAARLVSTDDEKEAFALKVNLATLRAYIESAPAIRLEPLRWVMIDETEAFVLGGPLLPLQGEAFWNEDDFLFPAGHALELPLLSDALKQILNPDEEDWIIWKEDGHYWKLPKEALQPLSIASVRTSLKTSA